jgi:flagellar biosynthesis chaperone FliJ
MAASDRLERVLRVRELQKRQALAEEAKIVQQRASLVAMLDRIDGLRAVYAPRVGGADAALLKGMVHQLARLQRPRDATKAQCEAADARLGAARQTTLETHRQMRAAEELHARAVVAEEAEAERRAERNALPTLARPLQDDRVTQTRGRDR